MKKLTVALALIFLSGCATTGVENVMIYQPSAPTTDLPEVQFGQPTEESVLFQFRYRRNHKDDHLAVLQDKGASMGASRLVVDCKEAELDPSLGCLVYGYPSKETSASSQGEAVSVALLGRARQ